MAEVLYNNAKGKDLSSGTLKMLLLKTAPAGCSNPDLDTITALLAVSTAAECDFTNYARKTLASVTRTVNDTSDRVDFDAASVTWTSAGGASNNTPVAAVIYLDVDGSDGNAVPYSFHDTGFSVATNGGDYTVAIADFARIS